MVDGCMAGGGSADGQAQFSMTQTNKHCNNTASTTTAMTVASLTLPAEPHWLAQHINDSNNINISCIRPTVHRMTYHHI